MIWIFLFFSINLPFSWLICKKKNLIFACRKLDFCLSETYRKNFFGVSIVNTKVQAAVFNHWDVKLHLFGTYWFNHAQCWQCHQSWGWNEHTLKRGWLSWWTRAEAGPRSLRVCWWWFLSLRWCLPPSLPDMREEYNLFGIVDT